MNTTYSNTPTFTLPIRGGPFPTAPVAQTDKRETPRAKLRKLHERVALDSNLGHDNRYSSSKASRHSFPLPRFPRLPPLAPTSPTRPAQLVISSQCVAAALATPIKGLLVTAQNQLGADMVTERARGLAVFVVAHPRRLGEPLELLNHSGIHRSLQRFLQISLSLLRRYLASQANQTSNARLVCREREWKDAVAHMNEHMARRCVSAQPSHLLEAGVERLLHDQGLGLEPKAQRRLQSLVKPAAMQPDLYPDVYEYMDHLREMEGLVGIRPDALKALIKYFVAARNDYIASIERQSLEILTQMEGIEFESDPEDVKMPDCSAGAGADQDADMADIFFAGYEPVQDADMADTCSACYEPVQSPPIAPRGLLNVLDRWIAFGSQPSKARKVEFQAMEGLEASSTHLGEGSRRPRRPRQKGTRNALDARARRLNKFMKRGG